MATADELLNAVVNDDKTLIIDSDLRTINIPKKITNIGVESDDAVLRLEFQMPKTYCGTDLSTFIISINYVNARAKEDVYDVDDMRVDGDVIRFSWLVERQVTRYKGDVSFVVCMKQVDSEGTVLKELF